MRYNQKTKVLKGHNTSSNWILLDAEGQVLGRLATQISLILQGKNSPHYISYADNKDFIVVVNIDKLIITGNKSNSKVYYSHSGYPGGLKEIRYKDLFHKSPQKVLMNAVKGMLPKNKLRSSYLTKLKLYSGNSHPHKAQVSN